MHRAFTLLAAAWLVLGAAAAGFSQSLGEIARKEEARRKRVAQAGKVYTNEDLRGGSSESVTAAPAPTPPAPAASAGQATPESRPGEDGPKKDEAYWRTRITEARTGLERAKTFQEALQSRINALAADFAARDDPAQRAQIATDRQKALAELDRVRKEIADYQKAIGDIEEEARRANVPPGWLR